MTLFNYKNYVAVWSCQVDAAGGRCHNYLFVVINGCKMMSEVISYKYHNNVAIVNCFGHEKPDPWPSNTSILPSIRRWCQTFPPCLQKSVNEVMNTRLHDTASSSHFKSNYPLQSSWSGGTFSRHLRQFFNKHPPDRVQYSLCFWRFLMIVLHKWQTISQRDH